MPAHNSRLSRAFLSAALCTGLLVQSALPALAEQTEEDAALETDINKETPAPAKADSEPLKTAAEDHTEAQSDETDENSEPLSEPDTSAPGDEPEEEDEPETIVIADEDDDEDDDFYDEDEEAPEVDPVEDQEQELKPDAEEVEFDYDHYDSIETGYSGDACAKKIWSVLKVMGLPDNNIAGILGNWYTESGIDPTSIEGIYSEPYILGSKKQSAMKNFDAYTRSVVWNAYSGISLNYSGYMASQGAMCGIGLGQFTGPNAERILSVAEAQKKDWYDLEFQMAYCLSDNYRPGVLSGWTEEAETPQEAAYWFMANWEGFTNTESPLAAPRPAHAKNYRERMKEWTVDADFAASTLHIAKKLGASHIDWDVVEENLEKYDDTNKQPVRTAADTLEEAALSLSYAREDVAEEDDKALSDAIARTIFGPEESEAEKEPDEEETEAEALPEGAALASAVRWADIDDNFPAASAEEQKDYLEKDPGWRTAGDLASLDEADLEPGDIITNGKNAYIVVENETLLDFYGDNLSRSLSDAVLLEVKSGADEEEESEPSRLLLSAKTPGELLDEEEAALKTAKSGEEKETGSSEAKEAEADETSEDKETAEEEEVTEEKEETKVSLFKVFRSAFADRTGKYKNVHKGKIASDVPEKTSSKNSVMPA